jgi:succinoglycan biosynthesis transport protein ExoP
MTDRLPPDESTPLALNAERETHLLDRLAVLHKHRYASTAVFLVVVTWFMVDSYQTIPMYKAEAELIIEEETLNVATPAAFAQTAHYQDPEIYLQTQLRVLKSRELGYRAVQRLDLSQQSEFNGKGPEPTPLTRVITLVKSYAKWPVRAFFAPAPPAPNVKPTQSDLESAYVDNFLGRVDVRLVRGSRLVVVSFVSMDAAFAARAVNVLAEEYVAQNLEIKIESLTKSLDWLDTEVRRQQELVQQSQLALADYREGQDAGALADNTQNIVTARLGQLNAAVLQARTERIQKQSVWEQLQKAGRNQDSVSAIVQNVAIQNLRVQLDDLERQLGRMSERYGPKHPEWTKVDAQLAEVRRQYAEAVNKGAQNAKSDYEAALAQERTLSRELEAQKNATTALNRKSIDYAVLQRAAETNQATYNTLLQRQNELRVIANSRSNNVRLVDRAEPPGGPFIPNHRRDWTRALLIGLVLAVALAFGLDYLDDTIKTPDDVTRRLRLRFLGLIPRIRGERHPLLCGPVPHDFAEAFRSLRTALASQVTADGPKIIAITSAQPLEGKTTTAVNIAMALTLGGARVLLIDADMRRPSVHHALRMTNERGLSQLLAGQARMREVVQRTHDPNLLAITAGRTPSNPSELLASDRMRALLGGLEAGPFDWILIDTPPVLAVTDAVIIAPLVTGVTFVIGADMTRLPLAETAIERILSTGPRTVAAVLNKVDIVRNRYYYSRYYGHQYNSYYAEGSAA